jgi:hypothetical protein
METDTAIQEREREREREPCPADDDGFHGSFEISPRRCP